MKSRLDDLALFGAAPAFAEPLHVGRPNVGDRAALLRRIEDVLDRNWLTNDGPLVGELERRIADDLGVRHCVAMCNGTIALEIAIRALGLDGEVIVPSFTFVATAHALQWQGITPVFADIDPETHTLDPAAVEQRLTPRTTGIIGVHLWGNACDVDALTDLADRHGLALLFDAAHAYRCRWRGTPLGRFGRAEVLSFHATKFVNSLEGGAIVTDDDLLAEKARLMRNFGFVDYDTVDYLGTNGKMDELSAAMGLTSLDAVDEIVGRNVDNFGTYRTVLADLPGIRLREPHEPDVHNHQYVVVEVDEGAAGLHRDALLALLWADNVRARRYFHPGVHRMEPYRSRYPGEQAHLPVTEAVADRVLVLPTGLAIDDAAIHAIASVLRVGLAHAPEVRAQLRGDPATRRAVPS